MARMNLPIHRNNGYLDYPDFGACPEGYEKISDIELKVGSLYKLYNQQTETYTVVGWYQGEQATHAADGSVRYVEAKFQLGNRETLLDYYDYFCLKDITSEAALSAPAARRMGRTLSVRRKSRRRRHSSARRRGQRVTLKGPRRAASRPRRTMKKMKHSRHA